MIPDSPFVSRLIPDCLRFATLTTVILLLLPLTSGRASETIVVKDFESGAATLLVRRCLECHQGKEPSGNLDLRTSDGLRKGGDSGAVVVAGDSSSSLLVERLTSGEMPPPQRGVSQRLPDNEIAVLRAWIDAGALWPKGRILDLYEKSTDLRGGRDWWSLQPVVRPQVPATDLSSDHVNPIDAFVAAKQKEHGLSAAPPASRHQLIRRMSTDAIGLPPSAERSDQFVSDSSPQAIGNLIDELLARPQFGERWARHWLDVVRFAESSGYERDQPKPFAWKYRDWVVQAFNDDLPFDQFIREQIAGDEIPERSEATVIATGFLRLGTWNDEPNDPEDYKYERLEDLVHATSSAFLGLTVKCARCHDHKFDPIPQADYYRMAAAFWPGPLAARERDLLGGPTKDELGYPDVLGWTDLSATPPALHLLKNGERHQPQQVVTAATLSFAPELFREFPDNPPADPASGPNTAGSAARTTGRRTQLADWIADERNPLTARVIVNRIWQHYFGYGLVRSSDNFGFTGDRPTHPELLDYLASELVRNDWHLKPIHRLILSSATYQQSSLNPRQQDYEQTDSANRWLWHANRRRLDAESLRDALLASSGELDLRVGGPGFYTTISDDALEGLSRKTAAWTASPPEEQRRRSLYMFLQRSLLPPMMTTFDLGDTSLPCGQRDSTIVAPQALVLLNNQFAHDRAEHLALRVLNEAAGDGERITAVWRAVLQRNPDDAETALALQHIRNQRDRFTAAEQHTWASLCLVLMNSNEFAFVD